MESKTEKKNFEAICWFDLVLLLVLMLKIYNLEPMHVLVTRGRLVKSYLSSISIVTGLYVLSINYQTIREN